MANAWDVAKGLAEKHAQAGGIFVRLANNGDKVTGVFCGEPYAHEVVWTGERYEAYDAKNPAHQGEGRRASLRVAINFFAITEGAMKVIVTASDSGSSFSAVMNRIDVPRTKTARSACAPSARGPGQRIPVAKATGRVKIAPARNLASAMSTIG